MTRNPAPSLLLAAVLCCVTLNGDTQMLARSGWTGSATAAQSWSKHSVIYEIDTRTFPESDGAAGSLKGITRHLDYLQSLGVDAILIDSLTPPAAPASPGLTAPIDPAFGTIDDFDDLSLQAGRHNLRVLIELPRADLALARFWLTRGVAGLYIPSADPADLQALRKLLAGYAGQRVLITDANLAAPRPAAKPVPNELQLDSEIAALAPSQDITLAGQLRMAVDHIQALSRAETLLIATGQPRSVARFGDAAHAQDMTKILGTVLLLNSSAALVYAGQELAVASPGTTAAPIFWGPPPPEPAAPEATPAKPAPPRPPAYPGEYVPYVRPEPPHRAKPGPPPDPKSAAGQDLDPRSALNFYRQLVLLHHGNSALRDGEEITIDHDDRNALIWVRKPPLPSLHNPAIVIVCNLSDKPLILSLKDDLARLHLRGNFLRPVLRSDDAMGSMHLDPMNVPPFGVFIGELRY